MPLHSRLGFISVHDLLPIQEDRDALPVWELSLPKGGHLTTEDFNPFLGLRAQGDGHTVDLPVAAVMAKTSAFVVFWGFANLGFARSALFMIVSLQLNFLRCPPIGGLFRRGGS